MRGSGDGEPISRADRWWIAAMAAAALLLAIAVMIEPGPLPGDLTVVRGLQRLGEPVPTLANWVRLATSTEATLIVFAVPGTAAVARFGRRGGAAVAVAAFTMLVCQPLFKEIVDRPRPATELVDVRADYDSKSFPSGHSMSTAAAWGAVVLVASRRRRPVLAAAACVPIACTAVASLVQGVHWPSDSVAGLTLGGVSAVVSARLLTSGRQQQE